MTLILTAISKLGIVHVSDSNVTTEDGHPARERRKLFRATQLRTGIACGGSYTVNGVDMDEWLPARISEYERGGIHTVAAFAQWLGGMLTHSMSAAEKQAGCWLHVAGYTPDSTGGRPEMYVVSNVAGFDERGSYLPGEASFRPPTEEFWHYWGMTDEGQQRLAAGEMGHWFNGFPAGRIAYYGLHTELMRFLDDVWDTPDWHFRRPRTLDEVATYLSLHLSVITHLFQISDYPPYIGGSIQRLLIPPPRETDAGAATDAQARPRRSDQSA